MVVMCMVSTFLKPQKYVTLVEWQTAADGIETQAAANR